MLKVILVIFLVFLLIRWIFRGFIRSLFEQVQPNNQQQQRQNKRSSSQQQQQTQNQSKKVIASDEGEYVDYEELKIEN